ncbi:MAG: hypothetical protein K0U84_09175 [Actinomycetia bacterium]|nr:hypothetical protein [Actinomycetes bacterium]
MELRWGWVLMLGLIVAVIVAVVALVVPLPAVQRRLRPLANVARLTRLPEYVRAARLQRGSLLITAALMVAVFIAALITTARPLGLALSPTTLKTEHPEDIMVCVGQPVTDPTSASLLRYTAQKVKTFDNQRIGLTSPTLRVIPMTGDYDYAAAHLDNYSRLPALQQKVDAGQELSEQDAATLSKGINTFSRTVDYLDYAPSVQDILALCMAGFPDFDAPSKHRRQVVFLGYPNIRSADETRDALFDTQGVIRLASAGGIQVNVLARTDILEMTPEGQDSLREIAQSTGGRFEVYNPAGSSASSDAAGGIDPTMTRMLDEIGDNPPEVVSAKGITLSTRTVDSPFWPLTVALVAAALLSVSLVVLRR